MTNRETDYRRWSTIDYKPAVLGFLPQLLLPLLPPNASVLEIGCGEGLVCRYLDGAGLEVTGIDINASAIKEAIQSSAPGESSSRIHYRTADILEIEDPGQYHAVLLIRVLTCFPDDRDWKRLLYQADAALREGGLLYIHDFAYDPDNSAYSQRYEEGLAKGWRKGSFAVRPHGDLAFVAFHHDDAALAEIFRRYDRLHLSFHEGKSMTGNKVRMFEFIGRVDRKAMVPVGTPDLGEGRSNE